MSNYMDDFKQLGAEYRDLTTESSETMKAFGQLHAKAVKDGALPKKDKELMSVAIAIAIRCEGCIHSHVASAFKAGATMDELTETIDVSILMSGGPGTVYGGKALAFAKEYQKTNK